MGAHKGIRWKDKPSKIRYFAQNHRRSNKIRNIINSYGRNKEAGMAAAERWEKQYA